MIPCGVHSVKRPAGFGHNSALSLPCFFGLKALKDG